MLKNNKTECTINHMTHEIHCRHAVLRGAFFDI